MTEDEKIWMYQGQTEADTYPIKRIDGEVYFQGTSGTPDISVPDAIAGETEAASILRNKQPLEDDPFSAQSETLKETRQRAANQLGIMHRLGERKKDPIKFEDVIYTHGYAERIRNTQQVKMDLDLRRETSNRGMNA